MSVLVSLSSSPAEDYFRYSLLILYVQQYSLRAYSPEVIDVGPEEQSHATWRDRPRSALQTHHIQERRTTKSRMATFSTPHRETQLRFLAELFPSRIDP